MNTQRAPSFSGRLARAQIYAALFFVGTFLTCGAAEVCLWPSAEANHSWGRSWNAADIGPKRDLVGELTSAVRRRGLRMGLYYSFFEWFNPLWLTNRDRFVDEHMQPQLKDLITRYQPDILWADGEWNDSSDFWHSREFLSWLFNESPARDIVINDRWGKECRHKHGGFYTTEFTPGMADGRHAWEENRTVTRPRAYDSEGRPLWYEWVYDRQLTLSNYYSPRELVLTLADTVSRGGNLILNVSPNADGRIPVIDEERLVQIGDWLRVNGEAIYGTHPWRRSCQWSEGQRPRIVYNQEWRVNYDVNSLAGRRKGGEAVIQAFFTSKDRTVYAIVPWWPKQKLILKDVPVSRETMVSILGIPGSLKWQSEGPDLVVEIPNLSPDEAPCPYAYVIRITSVAQRETL